MKIFRTIRKIFDTRYTDREIQSIQADTTKKLEDTSTVAKRHVELLKKNGVMMQIYIATGGDHHD